MTNQSQADNVRQILTYTFGLVPIVAGLDKFTNLLTHWPDYVAPVIGDVLPFSTQTFMYIVGVIEIIAGIVVLIKPKLGALIVMAWLVLISLNLLIGGHYLDVAVRDLVMAVGAFSLMKLSGSGNQAGIAGR